MSPAGGWPQLEAAIESGADAVYFGLNRFSARAKVGFTPEELPAVMTALHERGVQGFVTLNTLLFDDELRDASRLIETIALASADAVIVQDVAAARLATEIAPELPVHGSTQMTVTSPQGVRLARQLGCSRVVLARELSLRDIATITGETDMELEVFVHGALCVSYSGQCFSSEAWGGRSANRGQCAQACRLSYELVVDNAVRDTGSDRYLLSPGDLCAIDHVAELMNLGIACLKIEGRYKDANYVALTTHAYRQAIDRAANQLPASDPAIKKQLEQIYSRGLGDHFISGVNHQNVVRGRAPRHRGLLLGTVQRIGRDWIGVRAHESISAGDGVVIDSADWRSPDEPEEGGHVYETTSIDPDLVKLTFADRQIDTRRVRVGDLVWRTRDPKLIRSVSKMAGPGQPARTSGITFDVSAVPGKPLHVRATESQGLTAEATSRSVLQAAEKRSLSRDTLERQLGRLGGTPFHLHQVNFDPSSTDPLFLPVSELNGLRRELVAELIQKRTETRYPRIRSAQSALKAVQEFDGLAATQDDSPVATNSRDSLYQLHLLVRTPEQLRAAIRLRPHSITLDYLELYGLRPSIAAVRDAGLVPRVASPRILKPAEQNVIRFLLSLQCDILVRSGGLLFDLMHARTDTARKWIGDFSLNIANVIAARTYLALGLSTITPTHDLNADQITSLAGGVPPESMEVVVYHHLPVFHTEHCVFCRFLSSGTDHTNCGHPCEKHRVAVRDHSGREHPVLADVGCRNTVFGSEAQVAAKYIAAWRAAGLRDFRIEFAHENSDQVSKTVEAFRQTLDGKIDGKQLQRLLAKAAPRGVTEGSLIVLGERSNLDLIGSKGVPAE